MVPTLPTLPKVHQALMPLAQALGLPPPALLPLAVLVVGWLAMFMPTYLGLADTIWAGDEQGHGPIVLGVSLWLLWARRNALAALSPWPHARPPGARNTPPSPLPGDEPGRK